MIENVLITGSGAGLGKALFEEFLDDSRYIAHGYDRKDGFDVRQPDKAYIDRVAPKILINCAGVNGSNWISDVSEREWDEIMDINVKGMFLMSQACLPHLDNGVIINIVSNAAHMPMRCSSAYNASKGAAAILTKQMARELSPTVSVFSVSPNKLEGTEMSKDIEDDVQRTRGWTPEQAFEYQVGSLLSGRETPPELCAKFIFNLVAEGHAPFLTGCDLPYGA